ncbi:MAG: glycosyltransferase family 4 protein [Thermodesulfobacteriota bacterium]
MLLSNEKIDKIAGPSVLFIGPYPPPYSGPELGMKLLLESKLKEKFNIHFLKTNFRKTNVDKGKFDLRMVIAFFRFLFFLIPKLILYKPALVYYPITPTQIGWVGRDIWCLLICRLFNKKCIIHLRGGHLRLNLQAFHPLVRAIVGYSCKYVSLALVQAECLRDQFENLVRPNKVEVLYNAIETKEFENQNKNEYERSNILYMGHMTQAKGYCDLVRAIPMVARKYPDVKFFFAGNMRKGERGVFFDQITGQKLKYEDPFKIEEEIVSSDYKKNYVKLGIVQGDEKKALLAKANIFVLPSYSEGFSRAVLEALSMGKPVICTPVGAHKEVIKDGINGFLVKPGDVEHLAERIMILLEDVELRNRMGVANYWYARKLFDKEMVAAQMGNYMERIMNEPN